MKKVLLLTCAFFTLMLTSCNEDDYSELTTPTGEVSNYKIDHSVESYIRDYNDLVVELSKNKDLVKEVLTLKERGIDDEYIYQQINKHQDIKKKLDKLNKATNVMLAKNSSEEIESQINSYYTEITSENYTLQALLNVEDIVLLRGCSGAKIFGRLGLGAAKAALGCSVGPAGCVLGFIGFFEDVGKAYNYACNNCQACA